MRIRKAERIRKEQQLFKTAKKYMHVMLFLLYGFLYLIAFYFLEHRTCDIRM